MDKNINIEIEMEAATSNADRLKAYAEALKDKSAQISDKTEKEE